MATAKKKINFQNIIIATGAGLGSEFLMDKLQSVKAVQDKPYLAPLAIVAAGAFLTTQPKMEAAGFGMLGAAGAQFKTSLNINGAISRINGINEDRELKRRNLMDYIAQVQAVASNEPVNAYPAQREL